MHRPLIRSGLSFALFVSALVAQQQPKLVAGVHEDPTIGFKIRVPDKWTFVPVDVEEKWIVAKYLCNRDFDVKLRGGSFRPDMLVLHFSPEKAKLLEKTEEHGDSTITTRKTITFRSYRDWFDSTMKASQVGYTVDVEKTEAVGDGKLTRLEMSMKQTGETVMKVYAWVFERASDQSTVAVQFQQIPDWVEKVQGDFERSAKTFKFTGTEVAANANGEDEFAAPIWTRFRSKWRETSASERESLRKGLEVKWRERAIKNLPQGWFTQDSKAKRFMAISHADKKFTGQVLDMAEATWEWLDKRFSSISDDYVMTGQIRICKDGDEYQSYSSGSIDSGGFSESNREIVTFHDRGSGNAGNQFSGLVIGLTNNYLYDKDVWTLGRTPHWLSTGLGFYLSSADLEGRKLEFKLASNERAALRDAMRANALRTFNELISTPRDDWPRERESYRQFVYQLGALVRFIESKDAEKLKVFEGFYAKYMKAVIAAAEQWQQDHPAQEQAQTEAEEEARAKDRDKAGKEMRKFILDTVNKEVCSFSAKEWQAIEAAWKKFASGK